MAIDWGAWDYSGGNGMRVGIEVTWTTPSNSSTGAIATVEIYTQNQYSYSDDQTLSYGGSISGSTSFTNNDGTTAQLRATKTYNYSYTTGSYGSSPGNKTFTASLSGAFNGVTPSNSVTSAIPARPIAAPEAPDNVSNSRISDTSQKATWTRTSTNAKPWEDIDIQRSTNGGTYTTVAAGISGSSTSYTDSSTVANRRYRYQVRSRNSEGNSGYVLASGYVWTTPSAPTITAALTPVAGGQRVFWTNTCDYPLTSEFQTDIIAYKNGASQGVVGTVAGGSTSQFDHTTSNPVAAYTSGDRWKYTTKHRTTSGTSLSSAESGFTEETPGTTTPPLAPTNTQPDGLTVDPTLPITFSWTFQPGQVGDTQTKFDLQHRLVGSSTWTTVTQTTSTQGYTLPLPTGYDVGDVVEWQVRTYGADPVPGPYSAPVSFTTALSVILPDPTTWPVRMNSLTGKMEADTRAHEIRDMLMRAQSQLVGGGVRAVDASYGISWSLRFLLMSLGSSEITFPNGFHEIKNPFGWTVTNKALTGNIATITYSTSSVGSRIRPGDYVTVSGVGAPFNGTFVARSVTSTSGTTGTVTYDCVAANVASTASSGSVYCTIRGHGGAADTVPAGGVITLNSWDALYYELPVGWGSGATARKNGVVAITNSVLTSNKATFTCQTQPPYAVGDRITVSGCGAPYDGERTVTDIGTNTWSASITNANVGSAAETGLATPTGKDVFFGNFHVVSFSSDFVVPSNWIMIAIKNGDTSEIEWASGDSMPASYDSTVYNFGGQKISKFDAGASGSVTTDSNGDITITHSLGASPNYAVVSVGPGGSGNTFPSSVHTFTSTTFKVRFRQVVTATSGQSTVPIAGSGVSVSVHYMALRV